MTIFGKFVITALGIAAGLYAKKFLENNHILIINKNDVENDHDEEDEGILKDSIINLKPDSYDNAMDLRGTPTHICACGSTIWNLKVSFEDSQISTYFLDMECVNCGSVATAPTPIDKENQ